MYTGGWGYGGGGGGGGAVICLRETVLGVKLWGGEGITRVNLEGVFKFMGAGGGADGGEKDIRCLKSSSGFVDRVGLDDDEIIMVALVGAGAGGEGGVG